MSEKQTSTAHSAGFDVIIVGGGVAGTTIALQLPPDLRVLLITKDVFGESNTRYAQGGMAAAIGSLDSTDSHYGDTILAGAGHSDADAVRVLVEGTRKAVENLLAAGTQFDLADMTKGTQSIAAVGGKILALGNEAAHSHHRILHAHGDATGAEIERALVETLRARQNVTILEHTFVMDILVRDGNATGVSILTAEGHNHVIRANSIVLANGGAGQIWQHTSNPAGATADGIALGWRAGAVLTDLEFMQFHPTILVSPDPTLPAFLITEAVRGEGGYLRNRQGERFMLAYPGAELAPRDVVARGILQEMLREESDYVWLDITHLDADFVRGRFPTIAETCATVGIDITKDMIPVAPAAHYFMGGVAVDLEGRTTVPHLWSVGEVACTGVHGANRLASNSLLEGVVYAQRAAQSIVNHLITNMEWPTESRLAGKNMPMPLVSHKRAIDAAIRPEFSAMMWENVGLYRNARGLLLAARELQNLATNTHSGSIDTVQHIVAAHETANMVVSAQLIVAAALARTESRGSHARSDFPDSRKDLEGFHFFFSTHEENGATETTMQQPILAQKG